jgi:hypothetical protein
MRRPSRPRLRCEHLEDRTTPTSSVTPTATVDTVADVVDPTDGRTSLREAIAQLDTDRGGVISFTPALRGATIPLSTTGGNTYGPSAFEVSHWIRIEGSGQKITRADGTPAFRLFTVLPSGSLVLRNVELSNGVSADGGAVYNAGNLTVENSTLTGNTALGRTLPVPTPGYGGGIFSTGRLSVASSTITGNRAEQITSSAGIAGIAGAVFAAGGVSVFTRVTIADNFGRTEAEFRVLPPDPSPAPGAPLVGLQMYNSIIARSGDLPGGAILLTVDAGVDYVEGASNLIRSQSGFTGQIISTADPRLGPLQDNGGFTRTRALSPGSSAVNARPVENGAADQRGLEETGIYSDIGAYDTNTDLTVVPVVPVVPPLHPEPAPPSVPLPSLATGAAAGQPPEVRVYDADGKLLKSFLAYDRGFTGGVTVAIGDVTGDGIPDVVTAAGVGGAPHVKVFDGATFAEVRSFFAYDAGFTGGVSVAVNDLDGDDKAEIVTGAGAGGAPHVCVFDGATGVAVKSFFAFDPSFRGGVSVAVTGKGTFDNGSIITGAGAGGAPHVKVFDGATAEERYSFLAYDEGFRGGVNVATAWSGVVLTGPGVGGAPHVKLFCAAYNQQQQMAEVGSFLAGSPTDTSGVLVGHGYERSLFHPPSGYYLSIDSLIVAAVPGADGTIQVKRFRSALTSQDGMTPVYAATETPYPETDWGPVGAIGHFTAQRTLYSNDPAQPVVPPVVPPTVPPPSGNPPTGTAPSVTDPNWVATGSGLKTWDVRPGDGPAVTANSTIIVRYTGWLANGTVIDTTGPNGNPATFPLQQLIQGWREGLLGMKVGGIRRLCIPPELAYGTVGTPPNIPPNATLLFEVELVGVS